MRLTVILMYTGDYDVVNSGSGPAVDIIRGLSSDIAYECDGKVSKLALTVRRA